MTTERDDGALDALLAEWATPAESRGLRERIVASARIAPRRPWRAWWAGAAGLGLAGAMAGALLAAVLAPAPVEPQAGDVAFATGSTVFGDLDEATES
jgi:anti-sigma factor RsiW